MKKVLITLSVILAATGLFYLMQPQTNVSGHININQATAGELSLLPCIGPDLADNIIGYRQANGPFIAVDELIKIKGISLAEIEIIRPCLTLEGPTELHVSKAEMRINPFPRIMNEIRCSDSIGILREACTR